MEEEIDTLAEKIVGSYGSEALSDLAMMADSHRFLGGHIDGDLLKQALHMEEHLQGALKIVYDELKATNELSLGMDDFIMALASSHETNLYLLRQGLHESTKTASLRRGGKRPL